MPNQQFNPFAGVMAWLWPGAGHLVLGEKKRGFLIMTGVLFLFVSGLFIGGIDSVDRVNDHLWFLAQAVCGPIAFATDLINQNYLKTMPEPQQFQTVGINKSNEMGTLFTALAGLMNLVVILDAMFFTPKTQPPAIVTERRSNNPSPAPPAPTS